MDDGRWTTDDWRCNAESNKIFANLCALCVFAVRKCALAPRWSETEGESGVGYQGFGHQGDGYSLVYGVDYLLVAGAEADHLHTVGGEVAGVGGEAP